MRDCWGARLDSVRGRDTARRRRAWPQTGARAARSLGGRKVERVDTDGDRHTPVVVKDWGSFPGHLQRLHPKMPRWGTCRKFEKRAEGGERPSGPRTCPVYDAMVRQH